ncbi:UNVERIFIED_CONTAM: Protein tyrosine phosphatase type IVA 1 [Siphonaria sp. JEL0065]|nr:Protein tyrosine phosphatase type IVA 1 [Siphonaria sp. JEL0065]
MPAKSIVPMNRVMSTVEYKNMKFVIFDAPTDSSLDLYLQELQTRNVSHIVRVCEPTYNADRALSIGIQVLDLGFADGTVPPASVVSQFLKLCNYRFANTTPNNKAIGIHCVAGLGRAPTLVAIALIESGMSAIEAVEFVRACRRNALNIVQLNYLVDGYKPVSGTIKKVAGGGGSGYAWFVWKKKSGSSLDSSSSSIGPNKNSTSSSSSSSPILHSLQLFLQKLSN